MSRASDIVIVMLRRPNMGDPDEKRSDPFWEFGSFGCTGCHRTNILNPKKLHEIKGRRLAFVQGGPNKIKLVYLTPPVASKRYAYGAELKWSPCDMPIRFDLAPVIISNDGMSDMPAVWNEINGVNRSTPVAQFASKFRSRRTPIGILFAQQLQNAYLRRRSANGVIAERYEEVLPYGPPHIDRKREDTYHALVVALKDGPDSSALLGEESVSSARTLRGTARCSRPTDRRQGGRAGRPICRTRR